jgi:pyocin large subunit-like protein
VGDARQTWGRVDTLADHFARHGRDFHARDAEDYAAQAAALLQRARANGLPAKRTADGTIRVYEPATGAFGAYNANGTTKTFFKPGSPSYFDRQPGERVDLRTAP